MATRRVDFYVSNDSGGMSVVAAGALQRIIDDERSNDGAFVDNHEAILLMLHGDDSFPARVVVGGELTEAERDEWMARVTWPLVIDGEGLVVAGGFDPTVFAAWRNGEDWVRDAAHVVDVPPGKWLIDVYTHRPTISGRFLDEKWPTPLGTWFRQSYAGAPFPRWLARELELSPELDPGHEEEWRNLKDAVAAGTLAIDEAAIAAIGYLVHVRPFDGGAPVSPSPSGGWFDPETGERTPAVCPRGLGTDAGKEHYIEPEEPEGEPGEPVDVRAVAGTGQLPRLSGDTLEVPLAELHHVFVIAWLMDPHTHPEVRIQTTAAAPPLVQGWHAPVADGDDDWHYRVSVTTPFGGWARMERMAAALAGGMTTMLELWCARPQIEGLGDEGAERVPGAGTLRLRGAVMDDTWYAGAGMPVQDADVWRHALAFAAEVAGGERLTLRSDAEAAAFADSWSEYDYLLQQPPIEQGLVRIIPEPDAWSLAFLARRAFAVRFGSVFPCQPNDDE